MVVPLANFIIKIFVLHVLVSVARSRCCHSL